MQTELRVALAGLGMEMVGMSLFQAWPSLPDVFPILILVAGMGLIAYAILPIPMMIGGFRLPRLPGKPAQSSARQHGLAMRVALRWGDDVGAPHIGVESGNVVSVWAALNIELANYTGTPKRVADLFMEVRRPRQPHTLIAEVDPVQIDGDSNWRQPRYPRRVDWLLEAASPTMTHFVEFSRSWRDDKENAPPDLKSFDVELVAELSDGKQVRVRLREDVERN